MKELIIIHSVDHTTEFLTRIVQYLSQKWSNPFRYVEITLPGQNSSLAIESITTATPGSTIVFLGHGASHCVYLPFSEPGRPSPFLNQENFGILEGKNFISLSCRSSEFIGTHNTNDQRAMLGFDDLPTHWSDVHIEREINPRAYLGMQDDILEKFREILVNVFSWALHDALVNHLNFEQFRLRLKLYINKQMYEVVTYRHVSNPTLLANILYDLKHGIRLFGDTDTFLYQPPPNTNPIEPIL